MHQIDQILQRNYMKRFNELGKSAICNFKVEKLNIDYQKMVLLMKKIDYSGQKKKK